jgi:hypothetical protein
MQRRHCQDAENDNTIITKEGHQKCGAAKPMCWRPRGLNGCSHHGMHGIPTLMS